MNEFVQGELYNRRKDIHGRYGGQQQGGISTPVNHDVIFIFTGDTGKDYGYRDEFRPDGTFWYTGEGQIGDMQMLRGNLAIKDHIEQGKALLLFEYASSGHVKFVSEVVCVNYHTEQRPDKNNNFRNAFVFHLAMVSSQDSGSSIREPEAIYHIKHTNLRKKSLSELREIATSKVSRNNQNRELQISVKVRSEAIKIYALKRADGVCEACGKDAPFNSKDGPYLEVHHLKRIADGGPDLPQNVAALCPNCHRRIHFGKDGEAYNKQLQIYVNQIEQA